MSNKEINKNWTDFKSIVATRLLRPQYDYFIDYEIIDGVTSEINKVNLYALDGFLLFVTTITDPSGDFTDFEINYKHKWNQRLDFVDPTGISQFVPSSRPAGTTTFFSSKGDNGMTLDFNLSAQDEVIVKNLTFNEDIYIKDGGVIFENAPFGAYFNVEVVHPVAGVLAVFCKNIFILGSGNYSLNSEDKSLLKQGLILRISLFNAPEKAAFKVVASIEGFRINLI